MCACVLEEMRHAVAGWMSEKRCKNRRYSPYFSARMAPNFNSAELQAAVGGCSVCLAADLSHMLVHTAMLSQEKPLLTKLNRSHIFDVCSYRRHIRRVTLWKHAQRGGGVSDRLRFPNMWGITGKGCRFSGITQERDCQLFRFVSPSLRLGYFCCLCWRVYVIFGSGEAANSNDH